jgi:hypothetical protein
LYRRPTVAGENASAGMCRLDSATVVPGDEEVDLFSTVTSEEMRIARVITGATMAAFVAVGFIPTLRRRAFVLRAALLALYLLACAGFLVHLMLR